MTLFEYVAIAFTLVFSYTAVRLIGGLPAALESSRRYWVHSALVAGQLFSTAGIFWIFWSFREVEWTFPRFLLALASPALVYYNACALIPESPGEVDSWRVYYFAVRRRYFVGVSLWAVSVAIIATVLLEMPITHPARVIQAAVLGIGVIGASTPDPRVHTGLAVFLVSLMLLAAFVVGTAPGSLAQ